MKIGIFASAVALGLLGTFGAAQAEIKARFAFVYAADSTIGKGNAEFARRVAEETNGEIKITLFPAGQLGGDDVVGRELSRGSIEFSSTDPAAWAGMEPLLDVHHLPYLVTSYEAADAIVFPEDSAVRAILNEGLAKHRMRSLALYELDFRAITNSRHPIRTVDDFKGVSLRVPGAPALRTFFEATGAQTVFMPFPELFVALQQGTVDGQDNGPSLTYTSRLFEAQKYMTLSNHSYGASSITVSERFWQKLSPEQQEILSRIAREVAAEQIAANRDEVQGYIAKMREAGIEVFEPEGEAMAAFAALGRGVWDKLAETYGEERMGTVRAALESFEASRQ